MQCIIKISISENCKVFYLDDKTLIVNTFIVSDERHFVTDVTSGKGLTPVHRWWYVINCAI